MLVFVAAVAATAATFAQAQQGRGGAPAPPPRPAPPPALEADYRIGPEDVLNAVVIGYPDYSRIVPVRPDGKISLPLVNDVMAAGLTTQELRAALTKGFAAFVKSEVLEVSVIVTEVHSVKVSVMGQVRTPSRFEVRSRATLIDVLAMAGGFTEYAKKDRILVRRADGTSFTFNYERYLDRPEATDNANIVLRAGDIIIVP
jgi:polysaccharide export outer membrane protein